MRIIRQIGLGLAVGLGIGVALALLFAVVIYIGASIAIGDLSSFSLFREAFGYFFTIFGLTGSVIGPLYFIFEKLL